MPRPTKEEIDEEILDAAAALFARHGVEQTSVQRVADAVGYSKTGLLHRFPSKEALREATVTSTLERLELLARRVAPLPAGLERDREVLRAMAELATRRPGLVAFVLTALSSPGSALSTERLDSIGEVLFRAFGARLEVDADPERTVRITTALGGLAVTSLACRDLDPPLVQPHLVAAALGALGHPADEPAEEPAGDPATRPTPRTED